MKYLLISLLLGILFIGFSSAVTWDNIAYWTMENQSGTIYDLTGNKFNLTVSGICSNDGILGVGLKQNSNCYANHTVKPLSLNIGIGDNAVSFWTRNYATNTGGNVYILNLGTLETTGLGSKGSVFLKSSENLTQGWGNFWTTNDTQLTTENIEVPFNTWTHYVQVRTSGIVSLYKNGVLQTNKTGYSQNMTPVNPIQVFRRGASFYNGSISEVGIWNRTLSSGEILELYNGGAGLSYQGQSVILNFPEDNSFKVNSTLLFNSTASNLVRNFTNATFFVWLNNGTIVNQSTKTVTGLANSTTINISNINYLASYKWNALWCSADVTSSVCSFAGANFSFSTGNFTEEFQNTLIEGQGANVNLNITFEGINTNILALLTWNNTVSVPSKSIIGSDRVKFTSNFIVPIGTGNSSGINISHYWRFYLPDGSLNDTTTPRIQTVYSLGLDNCVTFTSLLLNYTLYDEDSVSLINATATNSSIEVSVNLESLVDSTQRTNFSRTYNNSNNAKVCISQISSGFRIDAQAKYTANNYVVEYSNVQNATLSASNFPQHINLFPLLSSRSQEFLVTFKDSNFAPVKDALISVSRKYVGEGLFRTVESPKTNTDGQALVHLVLSDIVYTIQVSKNGRILGTFDNIVAFCTNVATGECTINLNALSTGTNPSNFQTRNNLTYNLVFDKSARTITSTFTTLDGSNAFMNLTGILFDNRGNTTACSSTVTTSSGSLTCNIPISIGNSTIRATLYKNGAYITSSTFSLTDSTDTGFGSTGIIMMVIMYITIPLMFISSGVGIVIGAIMGLIFGGLLNLYTGGSIIGMGSTIIWFIIAGAIIIWKINSMRSN